MGKCLEWAFAARVILGLHQSASAKLSWATADVGLCLTVAVALGNQGLFVTLVLFVVKSHFIRHNLDISVNREQSSEESGTDSQVRCRSQSLFEKDLFYFWWLLFVLRLGLGASPDTLVARLRRVIKLSRCCSNLLET